MLPVCGSTGILWLFRQRYTSTDKSSFSIQKFMHCITFMYLGISLKSIICELGRRRCQKRVCHTSTQILRALQISQAQWHVPVTQCQRGGDRRAPGDCWLPLEQNKPVPGPGWDPISKKITGMIEEDTSVILWPLQECAHVCTRICTQIRT